MSAVAEHAPEQLGIDGIEAPVVKHLQLAVSGRLARQAHLRISTDGRPHVTVEVRQRGDALPFVATYHGQIDETAELEQLTVGRLKPGAAVLVRGAGLVVERDEDPHGDAAPRLRLVECHALRELRFDDPAEAALL